MSRDTFFSDNRRVKQSRDYADFFSVAIRTQRGTEYPSDYDFRLSRYVCPGRMDYYSFSLNESGHVIFWTEQNLSLFKSIQMAKEDLDRPQVVEMMLRMRGIKVFHRLLYGLIHDISPRAKIIRKIATNTQTPTK